MIRDYPDFEEDDLEDDDLEAVVSKSQKKREMHELLHLTEQALTLSEEKLAGTGLDEQVLRAFAEARKMKPSGARNRQLKYITKLIKGESTEVLEDYLRETAETQLLESRRLHQLEKWRDRLIAEGDAALGEVLQEYPAADRQQLRTLIRQAQKETEQGKPPAASRKLFKLLRSFSG